MSETEPSKAWYLFPIMLWTIGGLISFLSLRKRNRRMAYKTLLLGILIPVVFFSIVIASSDSDSISNTEYSDTFVKQNAIALPYDSIMNKPELHKNEIVYFEGELIQVQEIFGQYNLRVKLDNNEEFINTDVIWVNYATTSDNEKEWLDSNIKNKSNIFDFDDETDRIKIWGVSKGLREYSTVIGNQVTIPEIDALIVKQYTKNKITDITQVSISTQVRDTHTISINKIPSYGNLKTINDAIGGAIQGWNYVNPNMNFNFVKSNGDVNINLVRHLGGLGVHRASVTDDGIRERQSITVKVGIEDCHSKYQHFTKQTLQYIIAHELGHYLGLRHIDDKNHLMYAPGFGNIDSVNIYDNFGLGIPYFEKPEILTISGIEIQQKMNALNQQIDKNLEQRQSLRNANYNLDENTKQYQKLAFQIVELKKDLECVERAN